MKKRFIVAVPNGAPKGIPTRTKDRGGDTTVAIVDSVGLQRLADKMLEDLFSEYNSFDWF